MQQQKATNISQVILKYRNLFLTRSGRWNVLTRGRTQWNVPPRSKVKGAGDIMKQELVLIDCEMQEKA